MIRHSLVPTAVLIATLVTDAWAQSATERWVTYRNPRFGTTADVPIGRVPRKLPLPLNGSGQGWRSTDGRAGVTVHGSFNSMNLTPAGYIEELYADVADSMDYKRVTATWFVVSGNKNGATFYERCQFTPDLRVIHCVSIFYPAAEARAWDAVVTRVSKSLRIGHGEDG